MSKVRIEVATDKTLDDVRPQLESALEKASGDLFDYSWDGDVLKLSGPGARGRMIVEDGCARLKVRLSLPASLFRSEIEKKLEKAMNRLFGDAEAAGRSVDRGRNGGPAADS